MSQPVGAITRSSSHFDVPCFFLSSNKGSFFLFFFFSLQTIAGGSGAGPNWHGTSGVHTHITNTRIGDVEILERRYPVLVHEFGLREGSAGVGKWRGGEGVRRTFEVTEQLRVSILSEVRPFFSSLFSSLLPFSLWPPFFFEIWRQHAIVLAIVLGQIQHITFIFFCI